MTTTTKTNGNTSKKNACLCGCKAKVRAFFAQGHDQRFRGFALRVAAGTASKQEQAAVKHALSLGVVLNPKAHVQEANARVLTAKAA